MFIVAIMVDLSAMMKILHYAKYKLFWTRSQTILPNKKYGTLLVLTSWEETNVYESLNQSQTL